MGVEIPTLLDALRGDHGDHNVTYAQGVPVTGGDDEGIAAAVATAADADVVVAVLGDQAGLFGRGTSGEGCDAPGLALPGRQEELLEALLASREAGRAGAAGRPPLRARPPDRPARRRGLRVLPRRGGRGGAGRRAVRAGQPGRTPAGELPRDGGNQPATCLGATLAQKNEVSNVDPTALFAFGHGLSYAPVTWGEVTGSGRGGPTDGTFDVTVTLRNETAREASEVVQVYLHDPVAEVARPLQALIAAQRVDLAPGESRELTLTLHADLTSYTGASWRRQVDPGAVELRVGASSADIRATLAVTMTGPRRHVGFDRVMQATVAYA